MERGPDSFLNKMGITDFCRELGIDDQLIPTNNEHPRSFVVQGRELIPPEGFYLMAPTSFRSLIRTPLLSPAGKARLALDLVLPRGPQRSDETLGGFVRRRLGRETLERVAQPLVGGIYTGDPDHLSLAATQPQFLQMEREQRSILLALARRRRQTGPVSGARYSMFLGFRRGVQTLSDAIAERIPDTRLNSRVSSVRQQADGWSVNLESGEELAADGLCLALPSPEVGRLVPELAELRSTPYASSATINFGFRREQVRHPLDGMGMVVPDREGRSIIACTFSSVKFPGRAPEGHVLLRAFAGGALAQQHYAVSDEQMVAGALGDLDDLLGIDGEPEQVLVHRWPASMPQYQLDHLEMLGRVDAALERMPTLALAGNGYRGVGIPDCVAGGFAAADKLLATAG